MTRVLLLCGIFTACTPPKTDSSTSDNTPADSGTGTSDDCPDGEQTWFADVDRDGYGNASTAEGACEAPAPGFVTVAGDCDDEDPTVNPAATEVWYDGLDQNCDGASD